MTAQRAIGISPLLFLLFAATPSQSPGQSIKPSEQAEFVQAPPQNNPTPDALTGAPQTPNQTQGSKDTGSNGQGLMLCFAGLMAVATIALAIFNCQLVGISRDMQEATGSAATAATKSAEAAELALLADRPYLVITGMVHVMHTCLNTDVFHANVAMKNAGKGPALIQEILIDVSTRQMPPKPSYTDLPWISLFVPVIENNAPETTFETIDMATALAVLASDYEFVAKRKKPLMVWGRITYTDVFEQTYETGFGWTFAPLSNAEFPLRDGQMIVGPKEYNYHRKGQPKQNA